MSSTIGTPRSPNCRGPKLSRKIRGKRGLADYAPHGLATIMGVTKCLPGSAFMSDYGRITSKPEVTPTPTLHSYPR
jgi:hypothetical protein